ncbi:MAG: hypothetical protein KA735_02460 [Burkholderiaceae bacterium]|nr:hypothetical protein [Burkholderiaceae bacterium]
MSTLSAIMMMAGVAVAASAQAASPAAMGFLEQHALAFVKTPGRHLVDADLLDGEKYYTQQRFPKQAGLSRPDADLDAITKSILLLESLEPPLPRARYLVTYNLVSPPGYPDFMRELVEVTRFNMGPTLRLDLAGSVPPEHLAPPEVFGVGPHVSWRFVMGPVMGMRAAVMQASRMELTDAQASDMTCLGQSCLALEDPEGPAGLWTTPRLYGSIPAPVYTSTADGLPVPARVAQELLTYVAPDGVQAIPYQASQPRLTFVLSQNVVGQDDSSSGLVYDSNVMDHEIGAAWIRFNQVAGMAKPELELLVIKRKRQF